MKNINIENFTNKEKELLKNIMKKDDKIEQINNIHNVDNITISAKTLNILYVNLNNSITKTNYTSKRGHSGDMNFYYHQQKLERMETAKNILKKLNKQHK